jgi:hypothetical protein
MHSLNQKSARKSQLETEYGATTRTGFGGIVVRCLCCGQFGDVDSEPADLLKTVADHARTGFGTASPCLMQARKIEALLGRRNLRDGRSYRETCFG